MVFARRPVLVVVLLFSSMAVLVCCDSANAQRPLERLQRDLDRLRPRGRILREIFGTDREAQRKQAQARLDEQRRRARAAQSNRRQDPRNAGRQPTLASPQSAGNSSRDPRPSSPSRQAKKPPHPTNLKFVLRESEEPEGLMIEKIDRSGAAWAAGLRQRDLIKSVGGIPVAAKDSVDEIVSILKDGDQIEFEYVRSGKPAKALVQFGDPPVVDAEGVDAVAPSARQNGQQRPSNRRGLNSVVDQSTAPTSRVGQGQPSQRSTAEHTAGRLGSNQSRRNWPVQPPSSRNAGSTRGTFGGQTGGSSRTSTPPRQDASAAQTERLQRRIRQQDREIQQLREQLRRAQQQQSSGQPTPATGGGQDEPGVDSLLDFGK